MNRANLTQFYLDMLDAGVSSRGVRIALEHLGPLASKTSLAGAIQSKQAYRWRNCGDETIKQYMAFVDGRPIEQSKRRDINYRYMVLTVDEIKDLAKCVGLKVRGELTEDEGEYEIVLQQAKHTPHLVIGHNEKRMSMFRTLAYYADYPEEGVYPLGKEIKP